MATKPRKLKYSDTVDVVRCILLQLLEKDQVAHLENRFITALNTRGATDTADVQLREFLISGIEELIFYGRPLARPENLPHNPARNLHVFASLLDYEIPDHHHFPPPKFPRYVKEDDVLLVDYVNAHLTPLRVQHGRALRASLHAVGVRTDDLATEYLKFCAELYNCTETMRSAKAVTELRVAGHRLTAIVSQLGDFWDSWQPGEIKEFEWQWNQVHSAFEPALKSRSRETKAILMEKVESIMGQMEKKFQTDGHVREYCEL